PAEHRSIAVSNPAAGRGDSLPKFVGRVSHAEAGRNRLHVWTEVVHQADRTGIPAGTCCLGRAGIPVRSAQEQRPRGRTSRNPLTPTERRSIAVSARPAPAATPSRVLLL